ncbi:MAG: O-antigen ligase family protein [Candidatus Zambryskibacteria bacterium]|nr:O-antigen ligase family protein [Candidatus Zambryskibacteria bacterium]
MNIKNILKWGVIGGLFAVPFVPFIVSSSMLFPFITGKGFAFRIIVEIVAVLYVLLALIDVEYRPKFSLITKAVLVFTGVVLLADLLGENPFKSLWSNYERMEGFVLIAHLAVYYIVASSVFHTKEWWDKFWNTSLVASGLMSLYGFYQLSGQAVINQGGVRVDATFGNASYLAIYMVFHMFLSANFFLTAKEKMWRWIYGALFLGQGVILYFTATRGAILGLIGGALITVGIIAWKERANAQVRKIAIGFGACIVLLVLIFAGIRNTEFVQKSPVLSRFSTLSFAEIKTQGRYYVWPMAIEGFKERPILGWGQENFNYVFNKNYNPLMYGQEQWFDRTHNVVLDWLIAGGILGLLSYLSLYGALLYFMWKKSDFSLEEKAIFTGFLAAYFFHNFFVFDNLVSYIIFFSLLAYVHGRSVHQGLWARLTTRTLGKDTFTYVAIPVAALALVALVYFVNVPAISASTNLIYAISPQKEGPAKNLEYFKKTFAYNSFGQSEALEQLVPATSQLLQGEVSDALKQDFLTFTEVQVEAKVKQAPEDARYLLFAGSFYNRTGQYDKAIAHLENAVKYSPKKPTMYFELGSSYLGKKDYAKTFEYFEKGYLLEPRFQDADIIYTIGALYAGKKDVAQKMLAELGLRAISDDRILRTFADLKDYQTVIAILSARIQADPKNPQNLLTLAGVYAEIGQKQQAIAIIQNLIKEYPEFKLQGDSYIKELSK